MNHGRGGHPYGDSDMVISEDEIRVEHGVKSWSGALP